MQQLQYLLELDYNRLLASPLGVALPPYLLLISASDRDLLHRDLVVMEVPPSGRKLPFYHINCGFSSKI